MRAGRTPAELSLSAVFLDRDGVINRKAPEGEYVTSWEQFEFLPGALEAISKLAAMPWAILVATNQRAIARGQMTESDLSSIHQRMVRRVTRGGGRIDGIYHCPHEGPCRCRKPEVGMFEDAARDHAVSLSRAAVVGDSVTDMEAARRIGAVGVKVGVRCKEADQVVADLLEGADWLIARFGAHPPAHRPP